MKERIKKIALCHHRDTFTYKFKWWQKAKKLFNNALIVVIFSMLGLLPIHYRTYLT